MKKELVNIVDYNTFAEIPIDNSKETNFLEIKTKSIKRYNDFNKLWRIHQPSIFNHFLLAFIYEIYKEKPLFIKKHCFTKVYYHKNNKEGYSCHIKFLIISNSFFSFIKVNKQKMNLHIISTNYDINNTKYLYQPFEKYFLETEDNKKNRVYEIEKLFEKTLKSLGFN